VLNRKFTNITGQAPYPEKATSLCFMTTLVRNC